VCVCMCVCERESVCVWVYVCVYVCVNHTFMWMHPLCKPTRFYLFSTDGKKEKKINQGGKRGGGEEGDVLFLRAHSLGEPLRFSECRASPGKGRISPV